METSLAAVSDDDLPEMGCGALGALSRGAGGSPTQGPPGAAALCSWGAGGILAHAGKPGQPGAAGTLAAAAWLQTDPVHVPPDMEGGQQRPGSDPWPQMAGPAPAPGRHPQPQP